MSASNGQHDGALVYPGRGGLVEKRTEAARSFYRVNQDGFIRAGKSADNNVRVSRPGTAALS